MPVTLKDEAVSSVQSVTLSRSSTLIQNRGSMSICGVGLISSLGLQPGCVAGKIRSIAIIVLRIAYLVKREAYLVSRFTNDASRMTHDVFFE